jgi:hypothetical protein
MGANQSRTFLMYHHANATASTLNNTAPLLFAICTNTSNMTMVVSIKNPQHLFGFM